MGYNCFYLMGTKSFYWSGSTYIRCFIKGTRSYPCTKNGNSIAISQLHVLYMLIAYLLTNILKIQTGKMWKVIFYCKIKIRRGYKSVNNWWYVRGALLIIMELEKRKYHNSVYMPSTKLLNASRGVVCLVRSL